MTADVSLAQSDARAAAAQTMSSKRTFTFQRVYNESAGQQLVFMEVVAPLVQRALAGYHCAVFAYGQTSSGKTHTMMGTEHEPGLYLLAAAHIFALGQASGLEAHMPFAPATRASIVTGVSMFAATRVIVGVT